MVEGWSRVQGVIGDAERDGVDIGVAVLAPDGRRFDHRGDDVFLSASTIKIAIMVALFQAIDRGELSLDDPYVLQSEDKVPGSGVLQHLHDGIELTLGDVVYLMMSISDNPATNILIDRLGFDAVNSAMRDIGLERSVLGRKMMGRPAIDGERENHATPNDLAKLVSAILDGTVATASSTEAMISLLERQQNARRIGRFVPKDTRWGSKTGSYDTVVNDAGFVMLDRGPMVIAVLTANVQDVVAGELIVSDISRAAMHDAQEY